MTELLSLYSTNTIMKKLLLLSVIALFLSLLSHQNLLAQAADLRFLTRLNCATNQYTATIQIKSSGATSFSIGTSSVFVTYAPASLSYVSYQAGNFSPINLCLGGVASSWDQHMVSGSMAGMFNLTMTLLNANSSCPGVGTGWIDVGTLTFAVLNPAGNPLLAFEPTYTSFNTVPDNNGVQTIPRGAFTGVDQPGTLKCGPCSPCLTIVSDRIR